MNDDHVLVRPLFRVLYGIVSAFCIGGIFLVLFSLADMWHDNTLRILGLLAWVAFISFLFLSTLLAHTGFIVALRGKPPNYLAKYLDKYQKEIDKK